jgi:hypothetical protein
MDNESKQSRSRSVKSVSIGVKPLMADDEVLS